MLDRPHCVDLTLFSVFVEFLPVHLLVALVLIFGVIVTVINLILGPSVQLSDPSLATHMPASSRHIRIGITNDDLRHPVVILIVIYVLAAFHIFIGLTLAPDARPAFARSLTHSPSSSSSPVEGSVPSSSSYT
jgi:hypothetical protein